MIEMNRRPDAERTKKKYNSTKAPAKVSICKSMNINRPSIVSTAMPARSQVLLIVTKNKLVPVAG